MYQAKDESMEESQNMKIIYSFPISFKKKLKISIKKCKSVLKILKI